MNFLEKDLETIIWENYEDCEEKGLKIDQPFYVLGKQYRQMQLAPYGIADLVNIHYEPQGRTYHVQVIELKKGKVDSTAYLQAKRYASAIVEALKRLRSNGGFDFTIYTHCVLIGDSIETSGDFVFALNADPTCVAYTYAYGFNGIEFTKAGKEWTRATADTSPVLVQLEADLIEHYSSCTYDYNEWLANTLAQHGDYSKPLLVTSDGILLNPNLLENGA